MDLYKLRAKAIENWRGLLKKAEGESRALTDEELAEQVAFRSEIKSLNEQIEAADVLAAEEARSVAPVGPVAVLPSVRSGGGGDEPGGNGNGNGQNRDGQGRVIMGQLLLEKDPMRTYETPRQFLSEVILAGQGRMERGSNERLDSLRAVGSDEHATFNDPFGGFLIPKGMSPILLATELAQESSAGLTQTIPMEAPIVRIQARTDKDHSTSITGGLTFSRKPESKAGQTSRAETEEVKLEAHSLFGAAFVTAEMMQDSPGSFIALLERGFRTQLPWHMSRERINGTGTGEYLGVMESPAKITVDKETGQKAASIVYQNLTKMVARSYNYGETVWQANQTTIPQLMEMKVPVGAGGGAVSPLTWQTSARDGIPSALFGRPIEFTEHCQALGTEGDIRLTNWNEYLEGELLSPQTESSIHVRWLENETAFRVFLRNAGVPWWRVPLTPLNGDTLSPIVTLETRG